MKIKRKEINKTEYTVKLAHKEYLDLRFAVYLAISVCDDQGNSADDRASFLKLYNELKEV